MLSTKTCVPLSVWGNKHCLSPRSLKILLGMREGSGDLHVALWMIPSPFSYHLQICSTQSVFSHALIEACGSELANTYELLWVQTWECCYYSGPAHVPTLNLFLFVSSKKGWPIFETEVIPLSFHFSSLVGFYYFIFIHAFLIKLEATLVFNFLHSKQKWKTHGLIIWKSDGIKLTSNLSWVSFLIY